MNHKTIPILLNILQHSKKAFSIFTLTLLLFSSFLLISTQTSISQPVDFDFTFGSLGIGAGQFNNPFGIAVDSMKNIYVADFGNNRIQVFDSAGNFLFMFGSFGSGAGQFRAPFGIAVDSMKNIYVIDQNNSRIQVFDSAGILLFAYGWGVDTGASMFEICTIASGCQAGINGSGAGQFHAPNSIAVDSMKNIYVTDQNNSRIQVFSQSQAHVNIPMLSEWGLVAMAGVLGVIGFMVIRRRKVSA